MGPTVHRLNVWTGVAVFVAVEGMNVDLRPGKRAFVQKAI